MILENVNSHHPTDDLVLTKFLQPTVIKRGRDRIFMSYKSRWMVKPQLTFFDGIPVVIFDCDATK